MGIVGVFYLAIIMFNINVYVLGTVNTNYIIWSTDSTEKRKSTCLGVKNQPVMVLKKLQMLLHYVLFDNNKFPTWIISMLI